MRYTRQNNFFRAAALSFIFFFAFAALRAEAAAGVPKILSYQGRLLDANGNLLGGAGTQYCFRFSIYDDAIVGPPDNKLWPAGTPSPMTISVRSGVFNANIGDVAAGGDPLTFDFQSTDTAYLNVEVAPFTGTCGTFENLNPRQRITASGYSVNADTLRGFIPVQEASGTAIPVLSSGNLVLGGVNPQVNATGTNALTFQGGGGSGSVQFFSSANRITSTGTLVLAGNLALGGSASSTNFSVSGYGLFPTINFTNASGTNVTASGYLQGGGLSVGGASSLGNVSSTNFSASGFLQGGSLAIAGASALQGLVFANATGTTVNVVTASTTNLFFTNASGTNETLSGYFAVSGGATLGNLSSTNLTDSGFLQVAGQSNFASVSSTNITATGYGSIPTFSFTTASGTNITASGYIFTPSSQFTNASGTNETLSGYLAVTGQSTLGSVSSTNLFASGTAALQGLTFANATGTGNLQAATLNTTGLASLNALFVSNAATVGNLLSANALNSTTTLTVVGQTTLASASGTNITASGYVVAPTLRYTNASGTNITATGYGSIPTFSFTTASGTNITASGYIFTPSSQFTNASGTNVTASGYLQGGSLAISGQSSLGVISSTNLFASGYLDVNGQSFLQSVSSTALTISGISGSVQCLQVDASGNVSGSGTACAPAPTIKTTSSTVSLALSTVETSTLSLTITPALTANEVWIIADAVANLDVVNTNRTITYRIRRGASCAGVQVGTDVAVLLNDRNSTNNSVNAAISFVDAPVSTSTQTYQLCAFTNAGAPTVTARQLTLQIVNLGADLSEVYQSGDPTIGPGEVVSLDPMATTQVMRSSGAYDKNAIGIVSTQPSLLMGGAMHAASGSSVIVALSGRVPVRVNTEGGPIAAGDYLVPSSVPGVAMKATRPSVVLGQAMTSFSDVGAGTITAFVKNSYFDGREFLASSTGAYTDIAQAASDLALVMHGMADLVRSAFAKIIARVAVIGDLFAKNISILPGGGISVPEGVNQVAGHGTLAAGVTEAFIANTSIVSSSKVFVTLTSSADIPLVVTRKEEGRGFAVGIARPFYAPISFDWLITQTYRSGDDSVVTPVAETPVNNVPPPMPIAASGALPPPSSVIATDTLAVSSTAVGAIAVASDTAANLASSTATATIEAVLPVSSATIMAVIPSDTTSTTSTSSSTAP